VFESDQTGFFVVEDGKPMADVDTLLQRLETLYSTVTGRRVTIPQKRLDKEFNPLFERLCAAYIAAPTERRIDVYLSFEARDNLLDALVMYGGNSAYKASDLARSGKRDKAIPILKHAITADAIVDGRGSDQLVERAQRLLLNAVEDTHFDLAPYAQQLDLSAQDFARRAPQLHQQAQHLNAAKALGLALQMDASLEQDEKLVNLAKLLTRKPAHAALTLLREPFQREKFVAEAAVHRLTNRKSSASRDHSALQFWLITVIGVVVLAVLPPLLFPLILGTTSGAGNTPPGLIVGIVTSVIYLMGRLKTRR
jgi:hypothetical protein